MLYGSVFKAKICDKFLVRRNYCSASLTYFKTVCSYLFLHMAPKRKASNDEGSKSSRRAKKKSDETTEDEDLATSVAPSKKSKKESGDSAKETQETSQQEADFTCDAKSSAGEPWNLKITSWNINGIRAWLNKDGLSFLEKENPDVLCLQETKCPDSKIPPKIKSHHGYHCFWLSGDAEGYSGVGLLSKTKPEKVTYGIGIEKHDKEGRCITAEYEHFFLVATYVPNAGRGLVRLEYRLDWDKDFRAYLQQLDSKKPVILCGDLNVAHKEIDLKNPKTNTKNAGFTKEERESFTKLLEESNFVDSFRHLYPDRTGAYTFWTYMMNARAKNVGWRLDYFVLSKSLLGNLCENAIRSQTMGSDHCPITLFMSFKK